MPRRHHSNPLVGFGSDRFKIGPMPVGSSPWILGPEFFPYQVKERSFNISSMNY